MRKLTITFTDNGQWVIERTEDYCGQTTKECLTGKRLEAMRLLFDSVIKLAQRQEGQVGHDE